MEQTFAANRRQFLKGSVAASLVISFNLPMPKRVAAASASEFAPNAFLRMSPNNPISVIRKHFAFGPGPYTGVATILADELDADWSQIRVESAPADHEKYANLSFGMQGTGGSSCMPNAGERLRNAGAEGRARLVPAAAQGWKVAAERITLEKGVDRHPSGNA